MSKKIKNEQKKFLGETLNQYDKALNEGIAQLDKKNREQNHKISSLVNSFDNEYLEKDVEGNMTTLENSKDGMVIINEIQGNTEVNYCKDGEKELVLNGDIDTQGESFVTLTEGVDGGLVDVSLEGNTEINLSKTKDPVLVTREFDDINCNVGKLQYTIDDVTTINDEPGKVDIDRIVGDTMVNHAVNGSEELILNAHINESGDNNITLNGVTSDGGKVDVALEGNTLVNVSNVKDDYITPSIEDKVNQGTVISLPEVSEGLIHIDEIEGNTLVNYCTDGAKELTLNGNIDVEGNFVTTTEGVDNGLVDVVLEGNTLVNLMYEGVNIGGNNHIHYVTASSAILNNFASRIKTSTTYTIIIYNAPEEVCRVFLGGCISDLEVKPNVFILTTGENKVTAEPFHFYTSNGEIPSDILSGIKIAILEGDYTNKEIPPYFEGMKSVGQDDENGHKIEVLSQNKNLFDGETEVVEYNSKKRTVNFIKVRPNTSYISNQIFNIHGWYCIEEYDNNFNLIEESNKGFNTGIFTTSENTHYVKLKWDNNYDLTNVMVVEGDTVPSVYIPHSSNKKEILLNEPLRGLPSGIKDRFVKIGGKWFIERNIRQKLLTGVDSEEWVIHNNSDENVIEFKYNVGSPIVTDNSGLTLSDKFIGKSTGYVDRIAWGSETIYITISKNKLATVDVVGFKQWLSNNNAKFIYNLSTPIYEPLEIEPTLNTYNDTTYISNNSIIPCNMQIKNTGYNAIIKPNTLYTVALYTNRVGTIGINLGGAEVTTTNNVATITTPETLTDDGLRFSGKNINSFKIMLLEGDRTNRLPNFFEGMKSSFEDKVQEDGSYKMKILMSNKNLVRLTSENAYGLKTGSSYIIHSENSLTLKGTTSYSSIKFKQKLKPLTEYHISCDVTLKKGSGATIRVIEGRLGVPDAYTTLYSSEAITVINDKVHINGTFTTKDVTDIAIYPNSSWEIVEESELLIENLQISEVEGDYVESKSSIIQFSSIAPLRGVGNVHDRLVFKDGKLMIERNCCSYTFDGNEGWIIEDLRNKTLSCRWLDSKHELNLCSQLLHCDTLPATEVYNKDNEGIDIHSHLVMHARVHISRLQTQDVAGFIQWLQNNPTTIVYQLAEPVYEEIPYDLQKLILESYANGTLFIDTNIPPTKVSFNCFEEELTYLYPSTSYTIQFMSDRDTIADVNLGGTQLLAQDIVYGINRISITTPETLENNKLVIEGAGAKIRDIVVTDTDREFGYFEGMKSVGECEELEVRSNNKNLLPSTHEFESGSLSHGLPVENSVRRRSKDFIKVSAINSITLSIEGASWVAIVAYGKNKEFIKEVATDYSRISLESSQLIYYVKIMANDVFTNIQLEEGVVATDYIPHQSNSQTLTHEPLRSTGEVKDKYVLLDGKWYIERNCAKATVDDLTFWGGVTFSEYNTTSFLIGLRIGNEYKKHGKGKCNTIKYTDYSNYHEYVDFDYISVWGDTTAFCVGQIRGLTTPDDVYQYFRDNNVVIIYPLATPTYEEIDYNPFDTYADITHISVNSSIPCNMVIKNHGYNLVALKENTQYTLYVNKNTTNALTYRLGDYVEINSQSKFTFTTPSTLTDKTLRIDGKGAKVNDLMLIEGTPTNDSVGYFDGLKSSYECEQVTDENDVNYGKYKVDIKVVGKNLFDKNKFINAELCTFNGIECVKVQDTNKYFKYYDNFKYNTQYTLTLKVYREEGFINRPFTVYAKYTDGTETKFSFNHLQSKSVTTNKNKTISSITGDWMFGGNIYIDLSVAQLEEGDTATDYEPYFESKQTIYLSSPLLKGDEIVWKDNKIQHYHKMKTVVFDGSDDEDWAFRSNSDGYSRFYRDDNTLALNPKILCDTLNAYSTLSIAWTGEGIGGHSNSHEFRLYLKKHRLTTQDVTGLKQWLQQNPVTVAYQLAEPYYEEISDYPLKLNVIANSSLSTESTIQVTNISFNVYEETLPYLYPNTKYYITFNADVDRNNIIIDLGGSHVVFDCKVGFNKVEITTPSDTTNLLTFSGTGVNIDHVKVTQQDIDEYFEGMKSVGECEELEITSANSDNTLLNTQQLTHKPLRAVGDVKDRYVLIDGNWYIERNCAKGIIDGTSQARTNPAYLRGDYFIMFTERSKHPIAIKNNSCKSKNYKTVTNWGALNTINAEAISSVDNSLGIGIKIANSKTGITSDDNNVQLTEKLLNYFQANPVEVVYELETPVYEEINYNPFEVYSDVTHISANSLIPSNMVVKNHGYNCILKPSTKYTVALNKPNGTISAKLGGSAKVDSTNSVFTITTPGTLNDNVLRLSGSGKVKDIMILEGDKTVNTPSYFEGIESAFEQEYDTEKGKYRVTAKVICKNLWRDNVELTAYDWSELIKLDKNKTYTASYSASSKTPYIRQYDENKKRIPMDETFTTKGRSITGASYISIQNFKYLTNLQLEEGDTATEYEPYKESNVTFYVNEPLRGIKGVKDKVYIQDNKMIVQRNYISVTFDGSDDEDWKTINNSYARLLLVLKKPKLNNEKRCENYMCDTLKKSNNLSLESGMFINDAIRVKTEFISNAEEAKQWFAKNPTTVVYQLAEPIYEEAECDLSKLVLENYENSSLIFESNIPVSANIRYSGEVPVVTQAKSLSSQVDNTTLDINENIIPYMCDIDYRIVELQLMNGDTQGEDIELLGIGDIEILGNENVLFNNREDKKYNYSYDMLKRDILSQRYSKEEYRYRLDRYLLANKISNEEYKELEGLLNNGK